jgi:hypothetical protein
VTVVGLALLAGAVPSLEAAVTGLAERPSAVGMPQAPPDPDAAILTLLAFTVGAPLAIFFSFTVFALVITRASTLVEPLTRPLRLPDAIPLWFTGSLAMVTVWTLRDLWLPQGLDLLAMIARAYVVWNATRTIGLF